MAPKANNGGSNTGMVVTIVFLVLLVIGLGITAYYGFAYQADKDKAAATAKKDRDTFEKLRNWEKFKALTLKADVGIVSSDELQDLATLRDQFVSNPQLGGDDRKAVDEMIQKLDALYPWDAAQKKPTGSFLETLGSLNDRIKKLEGSQVQIDTDAKTKIGNLEGLQKTNQTAIEDLQRELKKANQAAADVRDAKYKELETALATIADRNAEIAKIKEEDAKLLQDKEKKVTQLTQEDVKLKRSIQDFKSTTASKIDMLAHETPKGKIVSISRSGNFAYINLGSADNVKPQLTFSVFGVGSDGKPVGLSIVGANDQVTSQPKADLEVLNVAEPHLSTAKITRVYNPGANPVMVGDVIFNPSWNPTLHEHVAIAGLIDLTGDGRDSTQEFVRTLEKQGIIVDAYLDLRDNPPTIKGPGLGLPTNYLILGELPEFESGGGQLREGIPGVERKKAVIEKMTDMQNDAAKYGITTLPARRFMALIGYQIPRSYAPPDYSIRPPIVGGAKEAPKEAPKETPKEEK